MGFNKVGVIAISAWLLIACGAVQQDMPETAAAPTDLAQVAHHRWVLKQINGDAVRGNALGAYGKGLVPELDFGEQPHIAGFAGCNRYKGQAVLMVDGRFKVDQLATTMMMCPDAAMALERRYTSLLENWSQLQLNGAQLTLTQGGDVWEFALADWVQ
ncbi:META domain-containing protein [Simiduia aestuariiviva]|uniref:Heat shock protein HslJ n=1 Tax=Simiduia aestuariiviva TaxID=1510459 RepID=A0A839UPE4_9GAMM|nr:META domain-containing protein [Simiduia aestuariiviva]MBB3167255.1 heat shock protein HslJ [Simiduia aestuariiviva]